MHLLDMKYLLEDELGTVWKVKKGALFSISYYDYYMEEVMDIVGDHGHVFLLPTWQEDLYMVGVVRKIDLPPNKEEETNPGGKPTLKIARDE